ncbi:MAG TPA: hypothetical protein VGL77_00150 [Armatimonadota bacterium]|jgi:hypothetical protein
MLLRAFLIWGCGLWLVAGLESALGSGFPGPLLLLAIAAGLSAGRIPGLSIGIAIGFCSAAISGLPLLPLVCIGVFTGLLASYVHRFCSPRHLVVAACCALLFTFAAGLCVSLIVHTPLAQALLPLCWRSLSNALWMVPIYGIVLVFSSRKSSVMQTWEYS